MTVSKIASKIYQAAKKVAKRVAKVWCWRIEWAKAMKQAWRQVMAKRTFKIENDDCEEIRSTLMDDGSVKIEIGTDSYCDLKTMQEAQNWINIESKKYASKNAFYASEKYHKAYPIIKKLNDNQRKKEHALTIAEAMKEAGVTFGDNVFYDQVCITNVITYTGKIVNRKGIPHVKLNDNVTINGKKSIKWHKGFKKQNTIGRR